MHGCGNNFTKNGGFEIHHFNYIVWKKEVWQSAMLVLFLIAYVYYLSYQHRGSQSIQPREYNHPGERSFATSSPIFLVISNTIGEYAYYHDSLIFRHDDKELCTVEFLVGYSTTNKYSKVGGSVIGCCAPNRVVMGSTSSPSSLFGHLPKKPCARPDWWNAKSWSDIP